MRRFIRIACPDPLVGNSDSFPPRLFVPAVLLRRTRGGGHGTIVKWTSHSFEVSPEWARDYLGFRIVRARRKK